MSLFKRFYIKLGEAQARLMTAILGAYSGSSSSAATAPGVYEPVTVFTPVEPGSPLSSANYNSLVDTLLVDITALYESIRSIGSEMTADEAVAKNWVSACNNKIDEINAKIDALRRMYSHRCRAMYHEQFNKFNSGTFDGLSVSGGYLSVAVSSYTQYINPVDIDRITLVHYPAENHACGIFISSPPEFDIEKDYGRYKRATKTMIKKGTAYPGAWVSVLMSDRPVSCFIELGGDSKEYAGYSCLMRIFFDAPKLINRLVIDPATRYKLSVARLRYRLGNTYADDDSGWYNVTRKHYSDDIYSGDTKRMSGSGYMIDLEFDPVPAAALEILFNMPSYDIIRYTIDKSIIRNALMWDSITDNEYQRIVSEQASRSLVDAPTASSADYTNTNYLDRTIIDISSINDLNTMIKAVNSSLNINTTADLTSTGVPNVYMLNDAADAVAVKAVHGSSMDTVNKCEYVVGAYSIVPERVTYGSGGTYLSPKYQMTSGSPHVVTIAAEYSLPGLSTVEFFIVTDNGTEIPVLPEGHAVHREPMDASVSGNGAATFVTSLTPVGNVSLYKWENNSKVLVSTVTPNGKTVEFTGLAKDVNYVVEYATNDNSIEVSTHTLSPVWARVEPQLSGSTVILPTSPHIDYSYYDWDTGWGLLRGVAGSYSDSSVLQQDINSPMWVLPTHFVSGTFIPERTTSDRFAISGVFTGSGVFYFKFDGKDRVDNQIGSENYEYSYMWAVPVSGYELPLASTVYLTNSNLAATIEGAYNYNRYEPLELFINGIKAKDVTQYMSNTQPLLASCTAENYEYFIDGNIVHTNVNIEAIGKRISARYRYITETLQVKIVMSNNYSPVADYTPRVDWYTLKVFSN